jgi:amino acid adenylation domain-containing protein
MSVQVLLKELSDQGVTLKLLDESQLSISVPRGRLSDNLLARIRDSKEELLRWLGSARPAARAEALPAIVPDPDRAHEPFALADLQAAFLMGERADMQFHVRPHHYLEIDVDELDPIRFEDALNAMLSRQKRNLPIVTDDLQLVVPRDHAPVRVGVDDLRGLPEDQAQRALAQTRERMSRQTLPLDRWPWLACRVTLWGDGKARIHYNNNNFFSDGYGSQKLLADTLRRYRDPRFELPPLTLSFRDCVEAIARIETSPVGDVSKRYWLDRVPKMPASLALPLRAGFDPRIRSRLDRREAALPAAQWAAFKKRAQTYGLTPTNALYGVYAEVLSHWSGSRHFLLNNMVTHRFPIHPEMKDVIGNFASLYPFEVDWRGGEPFFERARKLQARLMSDLQQAYFSGVSVLQALNRAQKTPGRATCPFVVGSGLFMPPLERRLFGCLETPQVLLDHQFWELADESLWFCWDLIEEAFPDGMIDAMHAAYLALLERFAVSAQPWTLASCDVLPDAQREQRERLNAMGPEEPAALLHEGLLDAAARAPDRLAVVSPGRELTYAQLLQAVQRLADELQRGGLRRGDRVPVALEKGVEQVVAAYAISTAGGAYVPVDPAWPAERIAVVLSAVAASQVVTSAGVRDGGKLPAGLQAVLVEPERPDGAGQAGAHRAPGPRSGDDLAYVIFTSGSTGTPKGVAISHAAAMNTIVDVNRRFQVTSDDRLFAASSPCFDLSVYDLFGSVAAGATLVTASGAAAADPQQWLELARKEAVTVWNSAPALMQLLVDAAQTSGTTLPRLRLVLLSGDWIPVALPDQIRRIAPNARVVSLGGATEASIWSIYHPVERCDPSWVSIPYGRPLANQTWHVLDELGADAPTWVPGHLHIGGRGLASGYWNDAERTRAAFVAHPRTGERLYRTGDLGRYLPDGDIEFLGRSDLQVKIQGFRIELGEVEHALLSHPGVSAAVVLAVESAGAKQLAAFVVRREGASQADGAALLDHVRAKVPAYMVPGTVTFIERLPLSANGKLDRDALRRVAPEAESRRPEYEAPRTATERTLVDIWQEVLAVRPIGIRDDFFDLGGHSFAAIRVVTRIAKQLGRSVPLGAMLQGRTVAYLADIVDRRQAWSPLVSLRAEGAGRASFFVHPAGGSVLCYRGLAQLSSGPFHALQAAGLDGDQEPIDTIERMAASYVEAVRTVQAHGPYVIGGWSSGGVIAFEMARQLEHAGEVVERVVMLDTPAPLQQDVPSDRSLLHWFIEDLDLVDPARVARLSVPEHAAPPEMLSVALAELRAEVADPALDPNHLGPVFAVFRSTVTACRRYHAAPIAADIAVLRAREGRVSEFLAHPADGEADWGWRAFTRGRVATATVPGTHHTILNRANVEAVAAEIRRIGVAAR